MKILKILYVLSGVVVASLGVYYFNSYPLISLLAAIYVIFQILIPIIYDKDSKGNRVHW